MEQLPQHLQKYIVKQNYEKYTPIDQAVWRHILRKLKKFLNQHAHPCYSEGLEKTGIEVESIPKIEEMSQQLERFGWRALPVSGFIPPAAFMELQSLNVLPIASDMRSLEHLLYTPAPDIVHEAAGHAPILIQPEYAAYLKEYAQVAKKAILSKEDLDQYEAIRELSDIKENPISTKEDIQKAEFKLKDVSSKITFLSEGGELSRMNWWTAEYGLIRHHQELKIFGAGLLSSVGESESCLSEKVKKIPLSLDCIKQSYDITEPQPQLFVADSFEHLSKVLLELSETMAYKQGGIKAVKKLIQAQTVNTLEFENGMQASGVLSNFKSSKNNTDEIAYLQFSGPTQLCYQNKQIEGHSKKIHLHGYGMPIGKIENFDISSFKLNSFQNLKYTSGALIKGDLFKICQLSPDAFILTFKNAICTFEDEILFRPEWGDYDVIIAEKIVSGFGGPADRISYGEIDDFKAARVTTPIYTELQKSHFMLYEKIRNHRQNKNSDETELSHIFNEAREIAAEQWLLFIEITEIAYSNNYSLPFINNIYQHLNLIKSQHPELSDLIISGLDLAKDFENTH